MSRAGNHSEACESDLIERLRQACDESRRDAKKTTFWLTEDRIHRDEVCQVFSDHAGEEEYGFKVKATSGGYSLHFCVRKYQAGLFRRRRPYARKSTVVARVELDLENACEGDVGEWFEYAGHKFGRKYLPRILRQNR